MILPCATNYYSQSRFEQLHHFHNLWPSRCGQQEAAAASSSASASALISLADRSHGEVVLVPSWRD